MTRFTPSPRAARLATFSAAHLLAAWGVWLHPPGARELLLAASVYAVGMFAVTAGYHRYFAHRTFETSRAGRFALAWLAESTLQKGVLWWAAYHRNHHRHSDQPHDSHSPIRSTFWHAHLGWVFEDGSQVPDERLIPDLWRHPELRWVNRFYLLPPATLAVAMGWVGGWSAVVWGFAVPILAVQHVTFLINSLAHLHGTRPYATNDHSRNNAVLAVLTLGEGWHNNHHHYPGSARQGFLWWEVDLTWLALRAQATLGLIWDLKQPPERVVASRRSASLQAAERGQREADAAHADALAALARAAARLADADRRLALAHEVEAT